MNKLMHVQLGNRFTPRIAKADAFVRKYYGLREKAVPTVKVALPPANEVDKAAKIYERYNTESRRIDKPGIFTKLRYRAMSVFFTGICSWDSGTIYLMPLAAATIPSSRIMPLLVHETTHYYQRDTPLTVQRQTSDFALSRLVCAYAIEGLAVLAEKEYKQQKMSRFERFKDVAEKSIRISLLFTISQALMVGYVFSHIFSALPASQRSKIATFVDRHEWTSLLFSWPYIDGYKFAKEISRSLGPEFAFSLLCTHPPSSFREIVDPEFYLSIRKVEIDLLTELNMKN